MAWYDIFTMASGGQYRRFSKEVEAAHGFDENGQPTGETILLPKNDELLRQYNKERGQGFRPIATFKSTDRVELVNEVIETLGGLKSATCNQVHKIVKNLDRQTLNTGRSRVSTTPPKAGKKGTKTVEAEAMHETQEEMTRRIASELLAQMGVPTRAAMASAPAPAGS